MFSPTSLSFWVFSNHSVSFTGSCCFLAGGESCLERTFLKYPKWLSEPEVTFRCRQNKPGGLEPHWRGSWELRVPQDTELQPTQTGGKYWELIFKYPSEIPAIPTAILCLPAMQLKWQPKTNLILEENMLLFFFFQKSCPGSYFP